MGSKTKIRPSSPGCRAVSVKNIEKDAVFQSKGVHRLAPARKDYRSLIRVLILENLPPAPLHGEMVRRNGRSGKSHQRKSNQNVFHIYKSITIGRIESNPFFKGFDGIISATLLSMENLFPQ